MGTLITISAVIAAIILVLIVLVQNSKGGGLAANFSSSNKFLGVRKTTDSLEKATWGLAGIIIVLSILSTGFKKQDSNEPQSQIVMPVAPPVNNTTSPDVTLPNANQPAQSTPNQ